MTTLIVLGIGMFGTAWVAAPSSVPTIGAGSRAGINSALPTATHQEPTPNPKSPAARTPEPLATSEPTVGPEPTPEPSPSFADVTVPPTAPAQSPQIVTPPSDLQRSPSPTGGAGEPNDRVPVQRPATPPTVTVSQIPWPSILLAAAILLLGAMAIIVLVRRGRRGAAAGLGGSDDLYATAGPQALAGTDSSPGSDPSVVESRSADSAQTLAALIATGEAMIDGGYPVDRVQDALMDIARMNGEPAAQIITFPTAVLVSLRGDGTVQTEAVSTGQGSLLLFQLEALDTAVQLARRGALSPEHLRTRIQAIRRLVPPFGFMLRLIAYVVLSTGLAVLLDASWSGVALAGLLGGFVGALMLLGSRLESRYQVLLTVAAAFVVSLVVFLAVRTDLDPGILPSLVAPLVILLPGALLTTGVIELSTGEIMAGSARLAAGAMRLVLLAFGIVAASALVGVPRIQLDPAAQPLGALAPWIGVGVFGVGLVVYQCARLRSLPWILLVLYVAYAAQVIGGVFLGAVLSAAIGALVVTPVAGLVARQQSGPPAVVSFLPAFWLLVPGALGLVGVTSILDGDASGLTSLITTVATMVAITLGVLVGLGLSSLLSRGSARRRKSATDTRSSQGRAD
ncbi:MAG: threonine/serine exporter family protein [Microbacteriaceae bacterium]